MKILFINFFAFLALQLTAQSGSNTSSINLLEPEGAKKITIAFPCNNIWADVSNSSYFIIEMHISANLPENVLKALTKTGRYNLEGVKRGDEFIIMAPRLSSSITVQGIELKEKITLYIQTPGRYTLDEQTFYRNIPDMAIRGESSAAPGSDPVEKIKMIYNKVSVTDVKYTCHSDDCEEIVLAEGDILEDGKPLIIERGE